jgi:hypothetical protein
MALQIVIGQAIFWGDDPSNVNRSYGAAVDWIGRVSATNSRFSPNAYTYQHTTFRLCLLPGGSMGLMVCVKGFLICSKGFHLWSKD